MFGVGVGMLYTPILVDRLQLKFPSGLAVANILRALTDPELLRQSVTRLFGGMALGIAGGIGAAKTALLGAILLMMMLMLFSAAVIYFLERGAQPDKFGSIPAAAWWALSTLTTVGYGDIVPVTPLGKLVSVFTIIGGLTMIALPVAIIAAAGESCQTLGPSCSSITARIGVPASP